MIERWVLREVRIVSPGWHTAVTMIWLPRVDPLARNHVPIGAVGLGGEGLGLVQGRAGHAVQVAEARADVEGEHALAEGRLYRRVGAPALDVAGRVEGGAGTSA